MKNKQSGFTLLELMTVLAIMGILTAMALPSFNRMMAKSQMQTVISEWRNSFFLAQKEAMRSKHRVILCPSRDGATCVDRNYKNFSIGWIVLDQSNNRVIQDFPPTSLMQNGTLDLRLGIGNGVKLNFLTNGRLPSNFAGGNIEAAHSKYPNLKIHLAISRGGRIRALDE